MLKRTILVFLFALSLAPATLYAQKFTKKAQLRREAREANYFYGASFTFTSGYVHSWLTNNAISNTTAYKGKSERWGNTNNHFDIGFAWDQSFNKHWGLQTGLYFTNKGGDHLYYFEQFYGPILLDEKTEEVNIMAGELQSQIRFFIPFAKKMRLSLNAGVFLDKIVDHPTDVKNWNFGPQVGLGFDWAHLSTSVTYQAGVIDGMLIKNSNTRQNALCVNIGYRIWKK